MTVRPGDHGTHTHSGSWHAYVEGEERKEDAKAVTIRVDVSKGVSSQEITKKRKDAGLTRRLVSGMMDSR